MKKKFKIFGIIIVVLILVYLVFIFTTEASNDRDWVIENAVLPHYELKGDLMTIYNIRNFSYSSPSEFTPAYYDKTYDLSKISSIDFIVAPFNPPTAHTFLSFGFEDGSYVSISIEARREKGESYSVTKGLLRNFETMYVVADESDVIKLRTNYREEGDVYMYPIETTPEKMRALFVDMMNEVNRLHEKPEFYNSITNNCTGKIVNHVNKIADPEKKIGFSYKYLLPAYAGEIAYEMDIIALEGTFEEVHRQSDIKEKAISCEEAEDFSTCIRE